MDRHAGGAFISARVYDINDLMRRSPPFRLFAAFFAPWFAFAVAEPAALHECPVHSVHAAASHPMAGHVMTDGAAMDDLAAPAHPGPSHEGSHHRCCCPDSSCASAAVALVVSEPRIDWVPAKLQLDVLPAPASSFVPASAEHALPFANGPPAARI